MCGEREGNHIKLTTELKVHEQFHKKAPQSFSLEISYFMTRCSAIYNRCTSEIFVCLIIIKHDYPTDLKHCPN